MLKDVVCPISAPKNTFSQDHKEPFFSLEISYEQKIVDKNNYHIFPKNQEFIDHMKSIGNNIKLKSSALLPATHNNTATGI